MNHQLSFTRAVLLDLDGTLYLGSRLFPETPRFLETLRRLGVKRLFLTNNSSRSTRQYQEKLNALGFEAAPDEILTSGWATIHYLLQETPHRKIYLLGTPGLHQEFEESGLTVVNTPDSQAVPEVRPDAVVLGFDLGLTYDKIRIASWLLREGAAYFATHPDPVCPAEPHPIPDTGSLIELMAAATGRRPQVIGKPFPTMVRAALARTGTAPQETAMVGDRLITDIKMAVDGGLISVLLLSGVTHWEDLDRSDIHPDYIFNGIGEFTDELMACRQAVEKDAGE